MQDATLIEPHLNYQKKLRFLSKVFLKEVDQDLLDSLQNVDLLFNSSDPAMKEGLRYLKNFTEFPPDNPLTELAVEYAKMFAGFHKDCPFPYESVYTSEERLMMQEARDQVLKIYREEEFEAFLENREPEDHISNELEFMAYLSEKVIDSLGNGKKELALSYWHKQKSFLKEHLHNWVPSFCSDIEKMAQTDFYIGIAKITPGVLASLPGLLPFEVEKKKFWKQDILSLNDSVPFS